MTVYMLKSIMDALRALGVKEGTDVRLTAKGGLVIVYIDGVCFGIYDPVRKTFVD